MAWKVSRMNGSTGQERSSRTVERDVEVTSERNRVNADINRSRGARSSDWVEVHEAK